MRRISCLFERETWQIITTYKRGGQYDWWRSLSFDQILTICCLYLTFFRILVILLIQVEHEWFWIVKDFQEVAGKGGPRSQNPAGLPPHVGSIPTSGTSFHITDSKKFSLISMNPRLSFSNWRSISSNFLSATPASIIISFGIQILAVKTSNVANGYPEKALAKWSWLGKNKQDPTGSWDGLQRVESRILIDMPSVIRCCPSLPG